MVETKEVKAIVEMKLPKNVDKNIGKACKDLAQTLKKVISPISKIAELYLIDAPCTLFAPLSAYLKGKSNEIAYKYLPFQNQIEMRKELSQIKMLKHVLENLADKEQRNEELPNQIEDTDNLFAIQNAASETTDDDFIKFWARLYTEEACSPNTVSKKTIDLCRVIDKKVAKILETEVFPYCSQVGFIANIPTKANNLLLLKDYGLVDDVASNIIIYPVNFEQGYPPLSRDVFGKYWLWIHPGYSYHLPYRLTSAGNEIRNALKIYPKEKDIKIIGNTLSKEAKKWSQLDGFVFHNDVNDEDLFVITDSDYPPFMIYPHPKYRKFERYWEAVRDSVTVTEKNTYECK